MRNLLSISLLLIAGAMPATGIAEPTVRIAVLEFRGSEPPHVLAAAADGARTGILHVVKPHGLLLMNAENMEIMLEEMGRECAEEGKCEVETARNIGADYVVSGEVVRIEGKLRATLKLYDSESGELLATEKAVSPDSNELIDQLEGCAERLGAKGLGLPLPGLAGFGSGGVVARIGGASAGSPAKSMTKVVVRFESEPEGATVLVGGELLCDRTPCQRELAEGTHDVLVQRERYLPFAQRIVARKGTTVTAKLEPTFGWLDVETDPSGLMLRIDDEAGGRSPIVRREIAPGRHAVVIADRCWLEEGAEVIVRRGEVVPVRLDAHQRMARVEVSARDRAGNALEARIDLDGTVVGESPLEFDAPVCSKVLQATTADGRVASQALSLQEGKKTSLRLELPDPPLSGRGRHTPVAPAATMTQTRVGPSTGKILFWSAAAVGTATWAIFGLTALSAKSDADSLPPGDPAVAGKIADGKRAMWISNAGAAAAIAFGITAIAW